MIHVSFTDLRKRLAHFMDRATQDHDTVLVTRQGSEPVVMIAQSEYEGMVETLHLVSNAKRHPPRSTAAFLKRLRELAGDDATDLDALIDENRKPHDGIDL
jgi:antitoxin YefM